MHLLFMFKSHCIIGSQVINHNGMFRLDLLRVMLHVTSFNVGISLRLAKAIIEQAYLTLCPKVNLWQHEMKPHLRVAAVFNSYEALLNGVRASTVSILFIMLTWSVFQSLNITSILKTNSSVSFSYF
jgi:hypothetical protein